MILAPISDPILRATVRRAALPEEDVFHSLEDVQGALRFGFPRLLVYQPEDRFLHGEVPAWEARVPLLALTRPTIRSWQTAWQADGLAVSRIDDSALRLRDLMRRTSEKSNWVEGLFADLTLMVGRGLPRNLKGFARRVMEYPARYIALDSLREVTGITSGALKARFRRRGLPSPAVYLRWFRIAAAARILTDHRQTTLTASFRMGFTSDGNFCRWIQANSGFAPSAFRERGTRLSVLVRLTEACLPTGSVDAWEALGRIFVREVA